MARALNNELAGRVLTKPDLDERLLPIQHELTLFGARLDVMEVKFNALNEKFETKFDALDEKFDTKFNALDTKITVLITMMLFGFTLLTALGLYNALPRATQTAAAPLMQESPQESPTAIVDAETKP